MRESIEKKTKQKKELERELNKMKTMVDATKEKVDKIEKEKAEMAKKEKMLGETIANCKNTLLFSENRDQESRGRGRKMSIVSLCWKEETG